MVRARMRCSTGIKTQRSRFDAVRGFQPYDDPVCMTAMRKYRPFVVGTVKGAARPFAAFKIGPRAGGEGEKADFG